MGHSVDEFFEHLMESTAAGKKLPNWFVQMCLSHASVISYYILFVRHGELYLEVASH